MTIIAKNCQIVISSPEYEFQSLSDLRVEKMSCGAIYLIFVLTFQVQLSFYNYPLTVAMQKTLASGFSDFAKTLLRSCNFPEELSELPLTILDDPNYDSDELPNILTFLAPGVVVYIVFFLAIILVGDFFIEEKEVC